MSRRQVSIRTKASAIVFAELAFGYTPIEDDANDRSERRTRWERRKAKR